MFYVFQNRIPSVENKIKKTRCKKMPLLRTIDKTKLQNRELNFPRPKCHLFAAERCKTGSNCKFPGHYCKLMLHHSSHFFLPTSHQAGVLLKLRSGHGVYFATSKYYCAHHKIRKVSFTLSSDCYVGERWPFISLGFSSFHASVLQVLSNENGERGGSKMI
jgi:hypothetical protein